MEIQSLLTEIKGGWAGVSALPTEVKALREGADKLATDLKDVRRQLASRQTVLAPRGAGQVSEGCARHMASAFIVQTKQCFLLHSVSLNDTQTTEGYDGQRRSKGDLPSSLLRAQPVKMPPRRTKRPDCTS